MYRNPKYSVFITFGFIWFNGRCKLKPGEISVSIAISRSRAMQTHISPHSVVMSINMRQVTRWVLTVTVSHALGESHGLTRLCLRKTHSFKNLPKRSSKWSSVWASFLGPMKVGLTRGCNAPTQARSPRHVFRMAERFEWARVAVAKSRVKETYNFWLDLRTLE
jgi:hypothetical protein